MWSIRYSGVAVLALLAAGPAVAEIPVDLELILAVDVSGSMDRDEQALQRRGYIEALLHPEVAAAVQSGPYGRIAIAYVEWAGPGSQAITVPWTEIEGAADAEDFATGLAEAPPARFRGTSISGALAFAAPMFDGNDFQGLRRVIDVSGDGPNNAGPPVTPIRDSVTASGIVVNGLPIQIGGESMVGVAVGSLAEYYRACVMGGPGAFVIPVTDRDQLLESIRRKLVLEIAGMPAQIILAAAGDSAPSVDCLVGERLRRVWEREP